MIQCEFINEQSRVRVLADGRVERTWGPTPQQFQPGQKMSWVADFANVDDASDAGQEFAEGLVSPNLHPAITTIRVVEDKAFGTATLTVRWNVECIS